MNTQEYVARWVGMAVFLGVIGIGTANVFPASPDEASAKHVNAVQAQKLMADKKVVVLDVRTPEEYKAGHISGATNIDFRATGFESGLAALDRSKVYMVYCASGNRSTQALPIFKKLQFQSLYHLDGGFRSWENAGLPAVK